jgi:hypothetical protein
MATWRELSDEQRDDLLRRKKSDESIEDLAKETGIYSITLARNLQKWERSRFGKVENGDDPQDTVFEDNPDPNHKVVATAVKRITTVEQLLAFAEVNPDEWVVERSQINKWEGYRKADKKHLIWEGGTILDGFVDDDGSLVIEPLYQVKVWLVRRKPIAIEPVVRPVKISVTPVNHGNDDYRLDLRSALFIPDGHIGFRRDYQTGKLLPFHDRIALDIVAKVIEMGTFDKIVILGDFLDMPEWSDKFIRTPDYEQLTQPAIEEAAWWLGRFRSLAPDAEIYYIEGNHEKRQSDMLIKHLPQAYHLKGVNDRSVFSAWRLPNLLSLDSLGIQWADDYPNGTVWLSDHLVAVHGDGLSAQKMVNGNDVNVVFGHIHSFDQSSRTIYKRGEPYIITSLCPGFLGKMDGSVPGRKNNQNWSQGIALAYYSDDGEDNNLVHVPIRNGRAVVEGVIVQGRDVTEHISEDTGERWNF